MAAKNHYQVLEIPTDAPDREVKRAYHGLAKRLHPDRASTPEEAKQLEEQMALVSQAYNVLKDPRKKGEYDGQLQRTAAEMKGDSAGGGRGTGPGSASGTSDPTSAMSRRAQIAAKAVVKGVQLIRGGEAAKAIEFLEAAVSNNEEDALAHAKLAEALTLAARSVTRAAKHAERAIELDPWQVEHRLTLAGIYERAGIRSRALEAFREVLKWDASNEIARAKITELERAAKSEKPFGKLVNLLLRRLG
jgi:tetratricopeptide (TPR) repeat protein